MLYLCTQDVADVQQTGMVLVKKLQLRINKSNQGQSVLHLTTAVLATTNET